jgi:hypothetical protein
VGSTPSELLLKDGLGSAPHTPPLLHTTSTSHGHNHLSCIQRRTRTPVYHLSRPGRAIRALRRLHLSLLPPPMVRPPTPFSLTPHRLMLTRLFCFAGLTSPSLYEPCFSPFAMAPFPYSFFAIGICARRAASRRGNRLQAVSPS